MSSEHSDISLNNSSPSTPQLLLQHIPSHWEIYQVNLGFILHKEFQLSRPDYTLQSMDYKKFLGQGPIFQHMVMEPTVPPINRIHTPEPMTQKEECTYQINQQELETVYTEQTRSYKEEQLYQNPRILSPTPMMLSLTVPEIEGDTISMEPPPFAPMPIQYPQLVLNPVLGRHIPFLAEVPHREHRQEMTQVITHVIHPYNPDQIVPTVTMTPVYLLHPEVLLPGITEIGEDAALQMTERHARIIEINLEHLGVDVSRLPEGRSHFLSGTLYKGE